MNTVFKVALGILLAAAAMIGGCVALLGVGLNEAQKDSDRSGITRDQFDRIANGMTEAEVKGVIGDAPEASSTSYSVDIADTKMGQRCVYYNEVGRLLSIYQLCFSEQTGRLESKSSLGASGSTSTTSVAVPDTPGRPAASEPTVTDDSPSFGSEKPDDNYEVVDAFRTPSGRSACQLLQNDAGDGAVQCGLGTSAQAHRVGESGAASTVPWKPPTGEAGEAEYGRPLYMRGGTPKLDGDPGDVQCIVTEDIGITCTNRDGHGFRVSVQKQERF